MFCDGELPIRCTNASSTGLYFVMATSSKLQSLIRPPPCTIREGTETRGPLHNHPMIYLAQQIAAKIEQQKPLRRRVFVCDHLGRDQLR
jgi:hypothetical protein